MGAFCSTSQSHHIPHDMMLPERITYSPPLTKRSSSSSSRTTVPSLFDLCLEELCNSLVETKKHDKHEEMEISSSPPSTLKNFPSFVSYGMSRTIWPSLLNLRSSPSISRCRALSLSSKHSPEMGPSSCHAQPHISRSTLTFHHRHLHLPEPIIQVIFDYMLSEHLLTLSHCSLFTRAHLASIALGGYPGITDDWLHMLLSSVPYQSYMSSYESPKPHASPPHKRNHRVSWKEEEDDKSIPMSVMHALTTSNTRTSAASVTTSPLSSSIQLATLFGDHSPHTTGLSPSPPPQQEMPTLSCLSPLSTSMSTSSSDSSMASSPLQSPPSPQSPLSPMLSSSDSSVTSSPLSLSPLHLTNRRISSLPPPLATHSLTYLDISKCEAITEYALRPLVACALLKHLNVEGCTQLSDSLFTFILQHTSELEYFNVAGLRGVTNATVVMLHDKWELKTLIMDQCTISDIGLRDLHHLHNLTHLSLGWCGQGVTHEGLHWLHQNHGITYLNVAYTGLTQAHGLKELHELKYMNVAGTKLSESGLKQSHQFPQLTHLDIQRSKFHEIPQGTLHYGLEILDLSFTNISAPKLAYQIASLARMKPICVKTSIDLETHLSTPDDTSTIPLHTLRMESCAVDNAVCKSIAMCTNLTELNLCDTELTNDGVKALTPLTSLIQLHLSGCHLTNTALILFETLTGIQQLYLDCPTITDGGLHYLRHLHNLQLLDLFETQITDIGIEHLNGMRNLKHLEICSGKLTNIGLNKIAQRLCSLTTLNVSQNRGISDAGVSVLSYLSQLRHINLSNTSVTHKGLSFIQSLPYLVHVSLFGCKVKPMSNKIKELPRGVQLGVDEGIVAIE